MRAVVVAAAMALLAGCASPPTQFYTMTPVAPAAGSGPAASARTVMLRRPGLAGYLDRPEIVRAGGDYRLSLANAEQWGEPFGSLLGRILVEDLSRRLPGTSVFAESGAISADPELTLEVDVQRFDADPGGSVVLIAQWSVERGRGNPAGPPVTDRISVMPASSSTSDLVAAMSVALGQEADTIAAAIRAMGPQDRAGARVGARR